MYYAERTSSVQTSAFQPVYTELSSQIMMLTQSLCGVLMSTRTLTLMSRTNIIQHLCRFSILSNKVKYLSTKHLKSHTFNNEHKKTLIPWNVLRLLQQTETKINGPDLTYAMNTLLKLYEQKKLPEGFHEQAFFKNLCDLMRSSMDILEMPEALQILCILNKIGVPSSSKIISSLLQHMDSLIMTSSIKHYKDLLRIIMKMIPTPTTMAIIKSLDRKFMIKVSKDFDPSDLDFLSNVLEYKIISLTDTRILTVIIEALHHNSFEIATLSNAMSLIKSFASMDNHPSGWLEVLRKVQNVLINNAQQMSNRQILSLLRGVYSKMDEKRIGVFYNKILFDKIAQKIIANDANFNTSVDCLFYFNKVKHVHKDLLSYIAAKFYEEKRNVQKDNLRQLVLITGLAYLKYKPIFWKEICESLQSKNLLSCNFETLIICSLHLACLDSYNLWILNRIFKIENFPNKHQFLCWTFLRLCQKLNMIPNYDGPMPSEKHTTMFEKLQLKANDAFLSSLEQGMGGAMYVKKNLKTKLYHHIDAIVAFRKGGYPIAINDSNNNDACAINANIEYLEDQTTPTNSQLFVILYTLPSWYCRNSLELLGTYVDYIESIKSLTSNVIIVNGKTWQELPEKSRVLFLMNEINSKKINEETW
ncbi:uncharacterized protein LOC100116673 isoform X1 [Nasonia vitripennis]|uniref:Uncharacterized protein n=2 Tax=Nasonia vitripennis TaxID=7425 RepID=A0A7M7HAP1_NASVI|nr:uncharacterized protein LOC100116673 isoform X1 [Nasonia vitripennis]